VTPRSLHARLVAGVAIWTTAVLAAAAVLSMILIGRYPHWGLVIHDGLLALSGAALVTAGVSVVRRGLSPLGLLRQRLGSVRDGRTARLEGEYPTEVAPLVEDLNRLLEEREARVSRAVAKAGDLAHGLKTPLAILAQDIARAEAAGQHEIAASIQRQVERMRRQINSHLAQARVTAGSGAVPGVRANVAEAAQGLARTMDRLYVERTLSLTVDVPEECVVQVPIEDLEESLGNLLDNACKWATSRVAVTATVVHRANVITVDDDGGGLDPSLRVQVLQRGVRADENAPGSGLGLAIVRDLAEAYGGSIALEEAPRGGVRARLTLPSAVAETRS
jgi:signal transduction histidine kinase